MSVMEAYGQFWLGGQLIEVTAINDDRGLWLMDVTSERQLIGVVHRPPGKPPVLRTLTRLAWRPAVRDRCLREALKAAGAERGAAS